LKSEGSKRKRPERRRRRSGGRNRRGDLDSRTKRGGLHRHRSRRPQKNGLGSGWNLIRQLDPKFLHVIDPSRLRVLFRQPIDKAQRLTPLAALRKRADQVIAGAIGDGIPGKSANDLAKFILRLSKAVFVE